MVNSGHLSDSGGADPLHVMLEVLDFPWLRRLRQCVVVSLVMLRVLLRVSGFAELLEFAVDRLDRVRLE